MISLVLDVGDGTGTIADKGQAAISPTVPVTSGTYPLYMVAPYVVAFTGPPAPVVSLVPTDDPSFTPGSWQYQCALENVAPLLRTLTFNLPGGGVAFTATSANPCVFTWTAAGQVTVLPAGTGVQLAGGSLPTGFSTGVTYYVTNPSGQTFQLAASQGGPAMASGSTGSGTVVPVQYNLSALALTLS